MRDHIARAASPGMSRGMTKLSVSAAQSVRRNRASLRPMKRIPGRVPPVRPERQVSRSYLAQVVLSRTMLSGMFHGAGWQYGLSALGQPSMVVVSYWNQLAASVTGMPGTSLFMIWPSCLTIDFCSSMAVDLRYWAIRLSAVGFLYLP